MQRKYGIYNYEIGVYQLFDTIDLAIDLIKNKMQQEADNLIDRLPISIVDINDDGAETWTNMNGEVVPRENGKPFDPNDITVEFMSEFENYLEQMQNQ